MKFIKCKLSELGEIVGGSTPFTKNESYYGGDIPWLTPKDLANFNGRYINFGERNITEAGYKSTSVKMLPINSVLFSSRAPIGYVAINNKNEVCTNQGFKSVIPNSKTDYMFLYYLLKYNKNKIEAMGSGTTFKEVSGAVMKNIIVNVPEAKEDQIKIGKILSKIDDKIELNTHTNDNLLKIGLELLKEDFNKKTEYEVLSNAVKFVKGKKPLEITPEIKEKYKKYLTIACLNGQELNYADPTKMVLSNNDLLMVMDGASSGDVYYAGQGIVGSTLSRIDCIDSNYISEFIYFIMKYYKDLIQSKNTGSAIPHTDKVFVGNLKVPKLLIEEQEKYKTLLYKILKNMNENKILEQLRDTLLPKLMNGEIDLDKIEI